MFRGFRALLKHSGDLYGSFRWVSEALLKQYKTFQGGISDLSILFKMVPRELAVLHVRFTEVSDGFQRRSKVLQCVSGDFRKKI